MKIFIINIESSTQRRDFQQAQADQLNLVVEFHRATTPSDFLKGQYLSLFETWERPMNEGEVACFLSHQALWKKAIDINEPILIMEDDAVLSNKLPSLLESLETIQDIDRITLEGRSKKKIISSSGESYPPFTLHRLHLDRAGAAGYILWPSGAIKLLNYYKDRAAIADKALRLFSLKSYQIEPIAVLAANYCTRFGVETALHTPTTINPERKPAPHTSNTKAFLSKTRRLFTQLIVLRQQCHRLTGSSNRIPTVSKSHFSALGTINEVAPDNN